MENNKLVLFFGLFILVAVVISTFNEYEVTGQIARGYPGNLPTTGPGPGSTTPLDQSVRITGASCEWNGDTFWACATVGFNGLSSDYSKAFFSGGTPLGKVQKSYESPFRFCDEVGDTEGNRVLQAYVYGPSDIYKDVKGTTVKCSREEFEVDYQKVKLNFRTGTLGPLSAFGTEQVKLDGRPISCEVDGYYEIVDRKKTASNIYMCNGATGILKGHIDNGGNQYVYENPGPFDWREAGSSGRLDPEEIYHEGYFVYATSCDPINYFDGDNYARATANIKDDGLEVNWDYYNSDTHPNIDFVVDLNCKVKGKTKLPKTISKELTGTVVEEAEEIPGVIEQEIELVDAPVSVWQRLKGWFLSLF